MNIEFESRLVEAYKSYLGDELIAMVIFGSRARGDHKENSDFDILIIAAHLPERHLARMGYIRKPLLNFDEKVQVLAKTHMEFDSFFPPLYLDIALDGKILVDKDGFMENRLRKIRKIIKDSSLYRIKEDDEFLWQWNSPKKPGWELDWGGLVEVTG
ncbi:MAG: nucleotidyltransferase domain-containing protein [Candidatus Methanoperedenaceae archaeon]|nr:nucleotidyltransferase domain-containing protein [Euryarchaeota archaeon]MCG2727346.1 nucleotidyltransferase domain-containing protein [Candidatus Methanoperedenaceae archaeon]